MIETKFRLLRPLGKDVFPEYEKRPPSWPPTAATPRPIPRSPITEPAGSGCLQTSPSTNAAAIVSHPRSPMTEPAGYTFLPSSPNSNTAATGSLPSFDRFFVFSFNGPQIPTNISQIQLIHTEF